MSRVLRFLKDSKECYGVISEDDPMSVALVDGNIYDAWKVTGRVCSLEQVSLLSPCTPTKVVGVGLNYRCVLEQKGDQAPSEPTIFLKPGSSVIGPGEGIVMPKDCEKIAYEAELAVIIKSMAKNVKKENASDYILGYTCANDITATDYMTKGSPWTKAKGFDTFTPLGPTIFMTRDRNPRFRIKMFLNEDLTQDQTTDKMIFGVSELLEYISGIMTLFPGDVIITGTPSGKGLLKRGDQVTAEIEEIGRLNNYVI